MRSRRLSRTLAALTGLGLVAACASAPASANPIAGSPADGASPALVAPTTRAYIAAHFGPDVRVRWDSAGTHVKQLHGLSVATEGADAEARAGAFVKANPAIFGPVDALEVTDLQSPRLQSERGEVTRTIVRMRQLHRGLPVEGRTVVITLDDAHRVITAHSDLRGLDFDPAPAHLNAEDAATLAEAAFEVTALGENASMAWVPVGTSARRAWKVPSTAVALVAHFFVWVDAETGAILRTGTASPGQRYATIPLRATPGETP